MRMLRAARARALSGCSAAALSGPGLHDVGADLADPRARVALHRLQGGEYDPRRLIIVGARGVASEQGAGRLLAPPSVSNHR